MQIVMIKSTKGSPTGIRVETYWADKTYDVPDDLGKVFIKMKVAEEVKAPEITTEVKMFDTAAENKMIETKVEKKGKKSV